MEECKGFYAICQISVASVRQLPNKKAPLLSQALFGEAVLVIRKKDKNWLRIECLWDGMIGWVDPKQFFITKEKQSDSFRNCQTFSLALIHGALSNNVAVPILLGSNLYKFDGINFKMPFGKYQYSGEIVNLEQSRFSPKLLINIAKRFLHAPELHGGRSITGIDADGFCQIIYKLIGLEIPRWSSEQCHLGTDIGFINEAAPGDLAFFENKASQIIHVGLVLDERMIIHVYGKVRIDKLDQQGIYNIETKRYSHKLRTVRRLIDPDNE